MEAPPFPLSSRPEESWGFGAPQAVKTGSSSATTLNGSAALPFVISTGAPKERSGEICGVSGPSLGMFSDRAMKNGSCSATTLNGSAALPFVISTGAPKERSGEICGVSGPSLGMFFDRAERGEFHDVSSPGFLASLRKTRLLDGELRSECE